VRPVLHSSYSAVAVLKFAQPIMLQIPLPPPVLLWPHRALRDSDMQMASVLQIQQFLAQQAVDAAHPEPCLLSTAPLRNVPGVDLDVIAAIEERMRVGTTVELDPLACLGPSFTTENSPKMYYDTAILKKIGRSFLFPVCAAEVAAQCLWRLADHLRIPAQNFNAKRILALREIFLSLQLVFS
jgi:hypothetical protein